MLQRILRAASLRGRGRALPRLAAAAALAVTALVGGALVAAPVASATPIPRADLYVILDRSGSMSTELATIKNNLATAVNELTCPPAGTGDPDVCIEDLWAGAGTLGYAGSTTAAFQNWVDLRPSPSFASIPTTEPDGCCAEPMTFAIHATITGSGGASYGISGVAPRSTCGGSPAANAGFATFGYPCFRADAITLVVLATDEAPLSPGDTFKTPDWNTVVRPAMIARGAYFVGLVGDGAAAAVTTDLQKMATDTGAVDSRNGNAPLVFAGAGATAATALRDGIRTLIAGAPRPKPLTANDAYTTAAETPLNVAAPGVLGNDTGDRSHPLRAAIGTPPAHGTATLNVDGSFTYTPATGFSGTDTFTYRASDAVSNAESDAVTVSVDVTAPPASPAGGETASGGSGTGGETSGGGTVGGSVLDTTPPAFLSASVRRATLRFRLSEAATVKITIRRGKTKPRRLTRAGKAGANTVTLRKLARGRYRVTLVATDAAGNVSRPRTLRFTRRR